MVAQQLAGAVPGGPVPYTYAQLEEDSTDESDDDAIEAVAPENAGYVPIDTVMDCTWYGI